MHNSYFAFGRYALIAGLRHLNVQPGDEVALPELICRDVLSSLNAVGAVPRFYKVHHDLRPSECGGSSNSPFVIMVNYFGFPQNIEDYSRLWPNATLIEDNAHGFLSRDSDGHELGTRTEVGFSSIRKTLRLPNGAVLTTRDPLKSEYCAPFSDERPGFGYYTRLVTSRIERVGHIPILRLSRVAVRALRRIRTGAPLPTSSVKAESDLPAPTAMSHWSFSQFKDFDKSAEVHRRRELFLHFLNESPSLGVRPVFDQLPDGCSPYGFPFYSASLPKSIKRLANKLHCEVIDWPDLPANISVPDNHFYRLLHVVNFL